MFRFIATPKVSTAALFVAVEARIHRAAAATTLSQGCVDCEVTDIGLLQFAPRGAQTATCKVATKQCNGRRAQTKDHQHQQCLALLFLGHLLARLAGPYYGPCAVAAS
jgi:hypothetical protein